MEETTCVMCNEMRFKSYGQQTSIGFVCFEDECVNDSRIKIDELVCTLATRLKEAEVIIKLQNDVVNRWAIYETAFGQEELEKRFGKIEHPDSSIWCEEWIDRVLRSPTLESTALATAWMKEVKT